MYKTRNTGTVNGMRGTRGIGGMLYSRECRQTFRGTTSNIPGNVAKHSRECPETFRELPQTFRRMLPNIPGNVLKHSGECRQIFRRMLANILGNVAKYSGECHETLLGISSKIPRNADNGLAFKFNGSVPKHWTQFY